MPSRYLTHHSLPTAAGQEPFMITSICWSTSSFAEAPDSSPMELSSLQDHVLVCQGLRGPWFSARCRLEALHGFVVCRLVTTVVAASALVGAVAWMTY
jgi:hypothetical protein